MSVAVYVLSTVTGYVLTSALLLKCPSLLHRRKRETFRSRHISHRGGESAGQFFLFLLFPILFGLNVLSVCWFVTEYTIRTLFLIKIIFSLLKMLVIL